MQCARKQNRLIDNAKLSLGKECDPKVQSVPAYEVEHQEIEKADPMCDNAMLSLRKKYDPKVQSVPKGDIFYYVTPLNCHTERSY